MARKKDFSGMNTEKLHNAIEQATSKKGQQGTASPQEQADRAAKMETQGRKGCKATRINMAFSPENYDFIKVCRCFKGMTMTQYTNHVIEKYRTEHPDIYEEAKALAEKAEKE